MPVLHQYRSKNGMYVKARHGKSMVTYQLEPAATAELRRRGMGEGSQVSPDVLHGLVAAGLAYTHGSGAGVVDNLAPAPSANVTVTVSVTKPSGDRLFPASCYADYEITPSTHQKPAVWTASPDVYSGSAVSPCSPRSVVSKPAGVVPKPFDWWRLAGRLMTAVTCEFLGMPMWLWLFMLVGVLVPGLLIASVVGRW